MKAKRLAWLGTRTREFEAHDQVLRGPLGLHAEHTEPDFAVFRLPNGGKVEVFRAGGPGPRALHDGPGRGFLVDDVEEARAELESAGISFIGPVHPYDQDSAWSHLVGPDGNVYR
jgi:hypothetical protein